MNIFLNTDGTAKKVTPEHIFQGSNLVTTIDVFAPYPPSTALEINFKLPDGTYAYTSYQPMLYVPYEVQPLVGVYTYQLDRTVTALAGSCYAAINAVDINGNRTSYLVKFMVEPSVLPELPPEPTPDVYELILKYLQQQGAEIANLDDRVTRLEDINVKKVLVDFTAVVVGSNAIFTKLYTDGSTASFEIPIGGSGGSGGSGLVVVTFTRDSWINIQPPNTRAEYELAFAPQQTGMQTAQFIAGIDIKDKQTYEAGTDIKPVERDGYGTLANRVFKGSDGSVLLTGVRTPFDGQLLCFNGKIDGDKAAVVGITLTADGTGLIVSYLGAPSEVLQLSFYSKQEINALMLPFIKDVTADEWSAEPAGYFFTILATEHGKGKNPTVYFKNLATNNLISPGVTVSVDGNIELYASVNPSIRVIIH